MKPSPSPSVVIVAMACVCFAHFAQACILPISRSSNVHFEISQTFFDYTCLAFCKTGLKSLDDVP